MENLIFLAEKYKTSLLATAIKFIKSCDDRGALVFSKAGKIKWTIASKTFTNVIKDSGPLHDNSNAIDFFLNGQVLNGTPQKVLSVAWLSKIDFPADYLIEETISMNRLDCTLSVIKPVIDEDDEDLYDEYY
jgi:hypothetical protein